MSSDEKNTVDLVPAAEMIPAEPGQEPPVPRITEEERAQLAEAWAEVKAAKNAQVALLKDAQRLDAERRLSESQANLQGLQGQQLELVVQKIIGRLQQRYNLPEGYVIDSKTGIVKPPEPKTE